MAQPRVSYCLCKHGPHHQGALSRSRAVCGYAHRLRDLQHPGPKKYHEAQWTCRVHEGGHGGIDLFMGQQFRPAQMQRYHMYLSHESWADMPDHAKMFAWFCKLQPLEVFCECGDFGFSESVSKLAPYWCRHISQAEVLEMPMHEDGLEKFWPFEPMVINGLTLVERLNQRARTSQWYSLYRCVADWDSVSHLMETEHMMTFSERRISRKLLEIIVDEVYVKLGEDNGWWLMVHAGRVREVSMHAAWACPDFFRGAPEQHRVYHELPCLVERDIHDESLTARDVAGQLVFFRAPYCRPPLVRRPGGGKCPRREAEVVCIVGVSTAMGKGFAAAFVCLGLHLGGRCSLNFADDKHVGELAGILMAGLSLLDQDVCSAVFLCGSRRVVALVFDEIQPTSRQDSLLYPCVLACRRVIRALGRLGVQVRGDHVVAARTVRACLVARAEADSRGDSWRVEENLWDPPLTRPLQKVFYDFDFFRRIESGGDSLLPPLVQKELDCILKAVPQ